MTMDEETTYKIIRFRFQGENSVIKTGLTLDEAQEHCSREDTHGGDTADGSAWFDGYEREDGEDDDGLIEYWCFGCDLNFHVYEDEADDVACSYCGSTDVAVND